jgi:anti-sigma factor RsiW
MTECPFQSRLSAFHDRELDSETSRRLEQHLGECESCKEMLAGIGAVSRLLSTPTTSRLSQMGLARLHATADSAAGRREVFPFVRTMIAVAASILIIAGAWLTEIPQTTPGGGHSVVRTTTPEADWEKLASGGKMDMPRGSSGDTGVALRFSNWMVDSLKASPTP